MATPIPLDLSSGELQRFWSRVDRGTPGECWLWRGNRIPQGYGQVMFRGKNYRSHRIAWAITNQRDLGDLHACHACDNRGCCNPDHLWLGTNRDNVDDAVRKGRKSPRTSLAKALIDFVDHADLDAPGFGRLFRNSGLIEKAEIVIGGSLRRRPLPRSAA